MAEDSMAIAGDLESELQQLVERLDSFVEDPERDAEAFARAEVTFEDPLRATRLNSAVLRKD